MALARLWLDWLTSPCSSDKIRQSFVILQKTPSFDSKCNIVLASLDKSMICNRSAYKPNQPEAVVKPVASSSHGIHPPSLSPTYSSENHRLQRRRDQDLSKPLSLTVSFDPSNCVAQRHHSDHCFCSLSSCVRYLQCFCADPRSSSMPSLYLVDRRSFRSASQPVCKFLRKM